MEINKYIFQFLYLFIIVFYQNNETLCDLLYIEIYYATSQNTYFFWNPFVILWDFLATLPTFFEIVENLIKCPSKYNEMETTFFGIILVHTISTKFFNRRHAKNSMRFATILLLEN